MTHWRVLAAVSAISWGGYFIFDIPAALSISLSTHFSLPAHQFAYLVSLLYTVYSIPNIVLPFLSGPAVQRFGERAVLLGTISSILLGQLLFALSIQAKLGFGLVAGRAFLGLGNEVIGVIGYEIITRWFQDRGLSLALAINLGAGRLGSVTNSVIVPRLVSSYGIILATWIATALALGVVAISAVYLLGITQPFHESPLLLEEGGNPSPSFFKRLPFRQFPRLYWHLALLCPLSYGCLTFTNSAQRFLAVRFYNGDQQAAGSAMSIKFILSGILVPTFGFLLDRFSSNKKNSSPPCALVASNILLFLGHGLFLMKAVSSSPVFPLCLLGTADALLSVSFWASAVKCLSQTRSQLQSQSQSRPGAFSEMETATTPLLKSEDEPILESFAELLHDSAGIEDEENPRSTGSSPTGSSSSPGSDANSDSATRTFGMGILASLMNLSAAVVPVPLAMMETVAGFSGLEGVFVVLACLGTLAALRLVWL
ncbi:major facilitator superfamily domain-containing protein [Aspergillus unguis]